MRLRISTMNLTIVFTTVFAFASSLALADTAAPGELVPVEATDMFVPHGFDNNDEVVAVIDGYLRSGCYKITRPDVNIDHEQRMITITPQARYYEAVCIQALVPYTQVVSLGVLNVGDYTVQTKSRNLSETLAVAESKNAGPDDMLYAPVDDVAVDNAVNPTRPIAIISGRLTNSCMRIDDVKVQRNDKTIEIFPLLVLEDRVDCQLLETPFRIPVPLVRAGEREFRTGRFLAHVRSLNGQSANTVFSVMKTMTNN